MRCRSGTDQIPAIAVEILEHGDLAIRLDGRRADEANAGGAVGGEIEVRCVGAQEEEDAPARLNANEALLLPRRGRGKEDSGSISRRARRPDRDPALVLRGLVTVLDQRKASVPT